MLLDSLLWTVLSSRAFTFKISRNTWRMSTSRRNRNKFTIIPTSATLKNTNVLTIHRRSDGGADIRNFIHRYTRVLHVATKFVGCDIYYYDPYKATITMTTTHFLRKMASNQTNRFQSLGLAVYEFIDGRENENTKKKTKQYVALFHELLVLKGETSFSASSL